MESYTDSKRRDLAATIAAAERTMEMCLARMATCKPRSRFAYASQITKAEGKRNRAQNQLDKLQGRW